jgi:hypothetical protein
MEHKPEAPAKGKLSFAGASGLWPDTHLLFRCGSAALCHLRSILLLFAILMADEWFLLRFDEWTVQLRSAPVHAVDLVLPVAMDDSLLGRR